MPGRASEIRATEPLSQLLPFNERRFDACMAYISTRFGRRLSQYDMMKLHVLTDIFHTLRTARPIIGGSLEPWKYGPVVSVAYHRVAHWGRRYDHTGEHPESFRLVEQDGNANRFIPAAPPDEDDFSEAEKAAMEQAWSTVKDLLDDWGQCAAFFHSPQASFIGLAWKQAHDEDRPIDWREIIDAYDQFHHTDHSHIKTLMVV